MDDTTNPIDPTHHDPSHLAGLGAHGTGDFAAPTQGHGLTDPLLNADPAADPGGAAIHSHADLLDSLAPLLPDGGQSWRELMETPSLDSGYLVTGHEAAFGSAAATRPDAAHHGPHLPAEAITAGTAAGMGRLAHDAQAATVAQAAARSASTTNPPNPLDMDTPDADEEDEGFHGDEDEGHPSYYMGEENYRPGGARTHEYGWTLYVSTAAWGDMEAAGRRVAEGLGSAAAEQFLSQLESILGALGEHPEGLGTLRPPSDFGNDPLLSRVYVYYVSGGPYPCDIFYRCTPDPDGEDGPGHARVEILRILHGSVEQPWLFPNGDAVTKEGF